MDLIDEAALRLLLIEDSEKLQQHLGAGLRKLGYEVQWWPTE